MAFVSAVSLSVATPRVGASAQSSFAGARFVRAAVTPAAAKIDTTIRAEASKSVPFWERPATLDKAYAGDVGFDPLGFSGAFDLKWLVEAELKHCRIAMLGALGMIFPEFYHLPNPAYSQTNPLAAVPSVGFAPIAQILLFMVVLEAISYQKITYNPSAPAGDFGFDPLGLSKNESARKRFALSEVKNGRLAMIACGGMIHHALITHQGPISQIQSGQFIGGDYPF